VWLAGACLRHSQGTTTFNRRGHSTLTSDRNTEAPFDVAAEDV